MPFDLLFERKPPSFVLQAPTGGGQLLAQLWGFTQGRQDQRTLSLLLRVAESRRVGEGAGEQERVQDQAMLESCIQNWELGSTHLCPWSFVNMLHLQSTRPVPTTELC